MAVTLKCFFFSHGDFGKGLYTLKHPFVGFLLSILGINRKVRYAMKESNGHFTIDPVSGIVSLARNLDREIQSVYNLTVYAHDQVRMIAFLRLKMRKSNYVIFCEVSVFARKNCILYAVAFL